MVKIDERNSKISSRKLEKLNPFKKLFHQLNLINFAQDNAVQKFHRESRAKKAEMEQSGHEDESVLNDLQQRENELQGTFDLDYKAFTKLADWPNHYLHKKEDGEDSEPEQQQHIKVSPRAKK